MNIAFIPHAYVLPSFLVDDFGTEFQIVPPGAADHAEYFRAEVSLDVFCHALCYGLNEV